METGANRERPGLREALAACRAGDTLVVTKLDRLARSLPACAATATPSRAPTRPHRPPTGRSIASLRSRARTSCRAGGSATAPPAMPRSSSRRRRSSSAAATPRWRRRCSYPSSPPSPAAVLAVARPVVDRLAGRQDERGRLLGAAAQASTVVLWELADTDQDRQQRALRLIGWAFVALGTCLVVQSTVLLAVGYRSHHSLLGIIWPALTAAVMFALAAGKTRTGAALDNPVLQTEGRVTTIEAILACAVLAGLALNTALGWWWADPFAGYALSSIHSARQQHADQLTVRARSLRCGGLRSRTSSRVGRR